MRGARPPTHRRATAHRNLIYDIEGVFIYTLVLFFIYLIFFHQCWIAARATDFSWLISIVDRIAIIYIHTLTERANTRREKNTLLWQEAHCEWIDAKK